MDEREVAGEGGGSVFDQPFGFTFFIFWGIYIEEAFAGFFQDKYLCSFFLWLFLSIFQWSCLYAFVMKMKWNTDVLAKHMKI